MFLSLSCNSQHWKAVIQKQVILVYPSGPPDVPYFEDNFSGILSRISFFCTLRESMPTMTMAHFLYPSRPSLSIHSLGAQFKMNGEGGYLLWERGHDWWVSSILTQQHRKIILMTTKSFCTHACTEKPEEGSKRRKQGKKTWKAKGFGSILREELWGYCKILCKVLTNL